MRKKSTRLVSAALAVCMMASTLPVSAFAAQPAAASAESSVSTQAEGDIPLTQENFEDENFLEYVRSNMTIFGSKKYLPQMMAQSVKTLPLNGEYFYRMQNAQDSEKVIKSLDGIEYFTELEKAKQKGLFDQNTEA